MVFFNTLEGLNSAQQSIINPMLMVEGSYPIATF